MLYAFVSVSISICVFRELGCTTYFIVLAEYHRPLSKWFNSSRSNIGNVIDRLQRRVQGKDIKGGIALRVEQQNPLKFCFFDSSN